MDVMLTCKFCGTTDDLDNFCRSEMYGTLPRNVYQCPNCRRAIGRKFGPPVVKPGGFVLPGKVEIVEVNGYL